MMSCHDSNTSIERVKMESVKKLSKKEKRKLLKKQRFEEELKNDTEPQFTLLCIGEPKAVDLAKIPDSEKK